MQLIVTCINTKLLFQAPIFATKEVSVATILDTSQILSDKHFILAALSDIHSLLQSAQKTHEEKKNETTNNNPTKKSNKQLVLYPF